VEDTLRYLGFWNCPIVDNPGLPLEWVARQVTRPRTELKGRDVVRSRCEKWPCGPGWPEIPDLDCTSTASDASEGM